MVQFDKLIGNIISLYIAMIYHAKLCQLFTMPGYGKTVSHVVIGLKTGKGTKQLKLDPSIYESLQKEKVEVGDVIYIEANSGAVKVLSTIYSLVIFWLFL